MPHFRGLPRVLCVRLSLCDGSVQAVDQYGDGVPVAAATGGFQCGGGFAQVVCAHQPRRAFDFVRLPGCLLYTSRCV